MKKIIYLTKSTNVHPKQFPTKQDVIHPSDNNQYYLYYNATFLDEDGLLIEKCCERRDKEL